MLLYCQRQNSSALSAAKSRGFGVLKQDAAKQGGQAGAGAVSSQS
jgi:hypothetical protein